MLQVTYKKIHLEGFQSFGNPVTFVLDRGVGVNIIAGSNGVGKSTIFNGILWAEYGGNLKKGVETWKENRTGKYRGTRVIIERTDGVYDWMIARHIGFEGTTKGLKGGDKLMVFRKPVSKEKFDTSDLVGDGLHKSDMQSIINDSLSVDAKTFMTSIFFGQRVKSLVESPNADKRKLFEELFDLQFVDDAKEIAKSAEMELSNSYSNIAGKMSGVDERIKSLKETLEEQQDVLENFDKDNKLAIEEIQEELDEANTELEAEENYLAANEKTLEDFDGSKEEELEQSLEDAENKLSLHLTDVKNAEARVREVKDSIEKSKKILLQHQNDLENVQETCPSCKKPLDKKDVANVKKNINANIKTENTVKTTLEAELVKAETKVSTLTSQTEELKEDKTEKQNALQTFRDTNKEFYKLSATIDSQKKTIVSKKASIAAIEKRLEKQQKAEPPKVDVEKTKKSIQEEEEFKSEAQGKLDELESKLAKVKWWISKGFSSSGLKAFVFNAMLHQLNKYAQKYASRLGFGIEFTIDMSKASKPFQTLVYRGSDIKDYEDLSGGQKQRVDICLAFAMHDLITHNKSNINILIVDELFEGLDAAGIEAAFDLIRQKGEEKMVYVITHSTIIDGLQTKHIQISADENGNTVITD